MNLKRFLDMLIEVELSQSIYGKLSEDEKLLKQYELINLINRGLENLHTRFIINKGELLVNVHNSDSYRVDITDEDIILSVDTPVNIIKILEIWNECGDRINFNTHHRSLRHCVTREESIQMVNKNTLVFSSCGGCYRIIYHRGPKLLERPDNIKYFKPEQLELDISLEYIDALIYYVASRIFSVSTPLDGNAAQFSPGIMYSAKFEQECERLSNLNLEIEGTEDSSQRFHDSMFP